MNMNMRWGCGLQLGWFWLVVKVHQRWSAWTESHSHRRVYEPNFAEKNLIFTANWKVHVFLPIYINIKQYIYEKINKKLTSLFPSVLRLPWLSKWSCFSYVLEHEETLKVTFFNQYYSTLTISLIYALG